ncbi:hypothetical protein [Actinomadura rifamycini]|uniref:hypothetical protein n=1 Tax=Actinomadura rifamycini TaxID=31962 RepID=UPI000409D867|nr:hypothetical protein [Actinomadura rifamycini]
MPDATPEENLEQLTSKELYDRAVRVAKDEHDVGFLWNLLRAIPPAAAALGETGRARFDLLHGLSLLEEFTHAGEGELGDALRPFYIEYLTEHAKRA